MNSIDFTSGVSPIMQITSMSPENTYEASVIQGAVRATHSRKLRLKTLKQLSKQFRCSVRKESKPDAIIFAHDSLRASPRKDLPLTNEFKLSSRISRSFLNSCVLDCTSDDSFALNQPELADSNLIPFKHTSAKPLFFFSPKRATHGQLSLKNKLRPKNRIPASPSPVHREENYSQMKASRKLLETNYEKVLISITPTLRSYRTRKGLAVGSFKVPGLNSDIPPFAHLIKERAANGGNKLPKIRVSGQSIDTSLLLSKQT